MVPLSVRCNIAFGFNSLPKMVVRMTPLETAGWDGGSLTELQLVQIDLLFSSLNSPFNTGTDHFCLVFGDRFDLNYLGQNGALHQILQRF